MQVNIPNMDPTGFKKYALFFVLDVLMFVQLTGMLGGKKIPSFMITIFSFLKESHESSSDHGIS